MRVIISRAYVSLVFLCLVKGLFVVCSFIH
jgi:hypothetical protein